MLALQLGVAFGGVGHAWPQAPQLPTSVVVFVSQPAAPVQSP